MNMSCHKNLKLLWWLRNIAIAGQSIVVIAVTHILQIQLDTLPLWIIIFVLAVVNLGTFFRLKKAMQISEGEFFAQLLVDISALSALLYFTGGAANPFASLFILQVIIAAVALRAFYSWVTTFVAIGCYTLLMFWRVDVPYFTHHHDNNFFSLHVQGMWISFIMLALIVAWFIMRMNMTIRRQNELLNDSEKLAALGTLAASAAHELGTPLATLMVLSDDAGEKREMFKEQLTRCKQILGRITAAGGVARAEGGAAVALNLFLKNIVARWQADHANAKLVVDIQDGAAPEIIGEYALEQAIGNLLDNAADASEELRLSAKWDARELVITVSDKGKGLPLHVTGIGNAGVTTKENGLGLGLFLARNIVARMDGVFELSQPAGGGVVAEIKLPLKRLAV